MCAHIHETVVEVHAKQRAGEAWDVGDDPGHLITNDDLCIWACVLVKANLQLWWIA
jgi:hypothetical protein